MLRPACFRYAFDPVCLVSVSCFAINRWLLKPHAIAPTFTRGYVNDLLCLPIFVPLSLWLQRQLRVRHHDLPPRAWEIVQHWIVFSVVFEAILPHLSAYRSTADPLDVLAYATGGVVAGSIWRRHAGSIRSHRLP